MAGLTSPLVIRAMNVPASVLMGGTRITNYPQNGQVSAIFGRAAAAEPGEGALDHPAARMDGEAPLAAILRTIWMSMLVALATRSEPKRNSPPARHPG